MINCSRTHPLDHGEPAVDKMHSMYLAWDDSAAVEDIDIDTVPCVDHTSVTEVAVQLAADTVQTVMSYLYRFKREKHDVNRIRKNKIKLRLTLIRLHLTCGIWWSHVC